MWDWLKSAVSAFTGGGGQAADPNAQAQPPAGGQSGTGATGSGTTPAAAAAMSHYADQGSPTASAGAPGAPAPAAPRFSPEMQRMYMSFLSSGMSPAEAQKTLMGIQNDPGGDTGAGPNASGTTRAAPGYGQTNRSR